MSLQFGTKKKQSTSTKVAEGVYVEKGRVKQVAIHYNAPPREGWNPDDVVLTLGLEVDGLDWIKELKIWGSYRWEVSGQGTKIIAGEGSAFKVFRVFEELGILGSTDPQGRIPQECLDQLYGKVIFFLQYVSYRKDDGKIGYEDYQIVAAQEENETEEETCQRLYQQFERDDYTREKRFHPELLSENDGAAQNGQSTAQGTQSVTSSYAPQGETPF